jgi:hypothetical protein
MAIRTALTEALGLEYPIVLAPWGAYPAVAWPWPYPTPADWGWSAASTSYSPERDLAMPESRL